MELRVATLDDMARIAQRYDTVMSRAMLKALGLPMPRGAKGTARAKRPQGAYAGMAECFANHRRVRI